MNSRLSSPDRLTGWERETIEGDGQVRDRGLDRQGTDRLRPVLSARGQELRGPPAPLRKPVPAGGGRQLVLRDAFQEEQRALGGANAARLHVRRQVLLPLHA